MSEHQEWLAAVQATFEQHQEQGAFQVLFPEYRPDLSHALAHHLELGFYDYRKEKMLSEGWEAGNISLEEMTRTLREESEKNGLVAHNIEALLATKTEQQRRQWLADCLESEWPNPVVMPLSIYQSETLRGNPRICHLELDEFPKESFLMRLAM